MHFDTVVLGGGPAGSTVGSVLRTYEPGHSVLILERERFPRDHVGESQLPLIGVYLNEIGVWDKVEAAGFPIKVGATYRWGASPDLWHFNFLSNGELHDEPRPATYRGQREQTAFQVDRAVYDQILLDHAAELGCEVRQETKVAEVLRAGDRVEGLRLESGEVVTANTYVDAGGAVGMIRRAMGIPVDSPTSLRNIAIWDYWQNAEWAEEIGVGGTRVQVLSLGYGWIWFIPLGPTRTSVGLVIPAEHYKRSGKRPRELYADALAQEPRIAALLAQAESEDKLASTNDWSYVAERLAGENWFLVGDACGFADPILAAGMTLAHGSAREAAYSILAIQRGEHDANWVKEAYEKTHRRRIRQHIRFADYWYTANGQFSDLKEHTATIAREAGLDLDPDRAFQWLGTGGFANDDLDQPSVGAYTVNSIKRIAALFSGEPPTYRLNDFNEFKMNLVGASREAVPSYHDGKIVREEVLVRGEKRLPLTGPYRVVYAAVQRRDDFPGIRKEIEARTGGDDERDAAVYAAFEVMLVERWIVGKINRSRPPGPWLALPATSEFVQPA